MPRSVLSVAERTGGPPRALTALIRLNGDDPAPKAAGAAHRDSLLVSAIAVAVLLGFVNARPEPQTARVTSRSLIDGEMVARVEAPAPYDPSAVIVADVVLPVEYQTEPTVPVRVLSDWSVEVAETGFRMPRTGVLVAVALLGAAFGLVLVNNLRGYG